MLRLPNTSGTSTPPATATYRPKRPVQIPVLEAIRSIEDAAERVKALFADQGKAGRFLHATLGPTLLHTARVAPDIAHSIDDVDRAMRWGFGWELGPFEIWDAIGMREVLDAMRTTSAGLDVPAAVQKILDSGGHRFRSNAIPPAAPELPRRNQWSDSIGIY